MAASMGSRRRFSYIAETTPGTTPATPTMQILRGTGGTGLESVRSTFKSAELRSDMQIAGLSLGAKSARMDWPFELSHGSFVDLFGGFCFADWKTALNVTLGVSCAVEDTGKTYTRASGSFVSDGFAVGDRIRISAFVNAGNNITGYITAIEATIITIGGASGLTDETLASGAVFTRYKQIKPSTTLKTFSIEEACLDITKYRIATGMAVDTFSLSAKPNVGVTGSFGLIGMAVGAYGDAAFGTAYTAATTSNPMNAFSGVFKENGTALTYATGFDLKGSRGIAAQAVLGTTTAYGLEYGMLDVNGTVSAYHISEVLGNKFDAETETSFEIEYKDASSNSMIVHLPRVKFSASPKTPIIAGAVTQSIDFQALYSGTAGVLTNMNIEVTA